MRYLYPFGVYAYKGAMVVALNFEFGKCDAEIDIVYFETSVRRERISYTAFESATDWPVARMDHTRRIVDNRCDYYYDRVKGTQDETSWVRKFGKYRERDRMYWLYKKSDDTWDVLSEGEFLAQYESEFTPLKEVLMDTIEIFHQANYPLEEECYRKEVESGAENCRFNLQHVVGEPYEGKYLPTQRLQLRSFILEAIGDLFGMACYKYAQSGVSGSSDSTRMSGDYVLGNQLQLIFDYIVKTPLHQRSYARIARMFKHTQHFAKAKHRGDNLRKVYNLAYAMRRIA